MALEMALSANSMATILRRKCLNFPAFFPVIGNLSENGSLWENPRHPPSLARRGSLLFPFNTNGPESVSKMGGQKCSLFTLFAEIWRGERLAADCLLRHYFRYLALTSW